jgi:hypothetical protein
MAQAVSRRPHIAMVRVRARVRPCRICGDQSGTRTGFSPVLWFSPVNIFHHGSPFSNIMWRMNNMSVRDRSSETSHPIDMNNKSNDGIVSTTKKAIVDAKN